jgi:hypothetical protein
VIGWTRRERVDVALPPSQSSERGSARRGTKRITAFRVVVGFEDYINCLIRLVVPTKLTTLTTLLVPVQLLLPYESDTIGIPDGNRDAR